MKDSEIEAACNKVKRERMLEYDRLENRFGAECRRSIEEVLRTLNDDTVEHCFGHISHEYRCEFDGFRKETLLRLSVVADGDGDEVALLLGKIANSVLDTGLSVQVDFFGCNPAIMKAVNEQAYWDQVKYNSQQPGSDVIIDSSEFDDLVRRFEIIESKFN